MRTVRESHVVHVQLEGPASTICIVRIARVCPEDTVSPAALRTASWKMSTESAAVTAVGYRVLCVVRHMSQRFVSKWMQRNFSLVMHSMFSMSRWQTEKKLLGTKEQKLLGTKAGLCQACSTPDNRFLVADASSGSGYLIQKETRIETVAGVFGNPCPLDRT
jgi:hypothetical protein